MPTPLTRRGSRSLVAAVGAALLGSVATTSAPAQRQVAHPVVHPAPVLRAGTGPRLALPSAPRRAGVFRPGFGPFSTFPFGGFRGGVYPGFGFPYYGQGFGGDTTARSSAEATASPRVGTAIINAPGGGQPAAASPTVRIPTPRLSDTALEAAGLSASGGGEGAAEVRKVLSDIASAREADRISRRTGSRYIYVGDELRELAAERRALRRSERRGRNPHILYLGFDK